MENKKVKLQESQGEEIKILWQKMEEQKKVHAELGDLKLELEQARTLN